MRPKSTSDFEKSGHHPFVIVGVPMDRTVGEARGLHEARDRRRLIELDFDHHVYVHLLS